MKTTAYRFTNEQLILAGTLFLVLLVIAISATATVCTSVIFIAAFGMISYSSSRSHHQSLLRGAQRISPKSAPVLSEMLGKAMARLQPGEIEAFVVPGRILNAYTFGLSSPKVVVLYSPLLKIMDEDELTFIMGHELGHVALGHTWLNSLVGGMAGIPSPMGAAAILSIAFLSWNRACEFSADRAGLLACGKPEKAVSALIKLVAGPKALSPEGLAAAYRQIDAEDDTWLGSLNEAFGTHPMLIRRIQELRKYAASRQYQQLLAQVSRNTI
jgi:Zn-dependent protease with chaperone function